MPDESNESLAPQEKAGLLALRTEADQLDRKIKWARFYRALPIVIAAALLSWRFDLVIRLTLWAWCGVALLSYLVPIMMPDEPDAPPRNPGG